MLFLRSTWRYLTLLTAVGGLSLLVACKGKSDPPPAASKPTYTISGTVKYTRIPLVKDANGVPLGLETDPAKFTELPARGLFVRAIKSKTETDASGASVVVWSVADSSATDAEGKYKLSIEDGGTVYVEINSTVQYASASPVRLLASDIASTVPVVDRSVYSLRKGADGSSPAGNPTPGVLLSKDATVDFNIGLSTSWWVGHMSTSLASQALVETSPSGSRIPGILDSAYSFASTYGEAAPGSILNLHYLPGTTWAFGVRPSFVEYDRSIYPASYDGGTFHYFGAIRAQTGLDDTWNESALFTMFARNFMMRQGFTLFHPTRFRADGSDLQDLHADIALVEGLACAASALISKSPYLVLSVEGTPVLRDIRLRSGLGTDMYSAANIAALTWEVALKANGLPSPGIEADWAKLKPVSILRFFYITVPKDDTKNPKDTVNLLNQVARLKEARVDGEPVDLAAIFTDAMLTPFVAPFGLTWPRPTTGPEASFLADWGKDPDSKVTASAPPPFTLSMAKAHLNALGVYPNFSKGEVFQARFLLTKDRKYNLTVQTPGGIPVGAGIEVSIGGKTYVFTASETSVPPFTLYGNATTPKYYGIQVRLLSPTVVQPDLPITLRLDAQN